MTHDLTIQRSASVSECRRYRWTLSRIWDPSGQLAILGWVMLNPSTADARLDDRSIRRCMKFSRAWGFGGMIVTNLFSYRATDPAELRTARDPIGARTDQALRDMVARCQAVVAAWGCEGTLSARNEKVRKALCLEGRLQWDGNFVLCCLGTTVDGHPRHPLYVPASTELELYDGQPKR